LDPGAAGLPLGPISVEDRQCPFNNNLSKNKIKIINVRSKEKNFTYY